MEYFLNKKIRYTDIANGIEKMLNTYDKIKLETVEEILEFDAKVKQDTIRMLENI